MQMEAAWQKLASELAMCGIFVCVDVDENTETAEKLKIDAMPMFQFYKNGTMVGEVRGAFKSEVETMVETLLMPV
jgi:thioredoxin-like negative regulator of GroEL